MTLVFVGVVRPASCDVEAAVVAEIIGVVALVVGVLTSCSDHVAVGCNSVGSRGDDGAGVGVGCVCATPSAWVEMKPTTAVVAVIAAGPGSEAGGALHSPYIAADGVPEIDVACLDLGVAPVVDDGAPGADVAERMNRSAGGGTGCAALDGKTPDPHMAELGAVRAAGADGADA